MVRTGLSRAGGQSRGALAFEQHQSIMERSQRAACVERHHGKGPMLKRAAAALDDRFIDPQCVERSAAGLASMVTNICDIRLHCFLTVLKIDPMDEARNEKRRRQFRG